MLRLKAPKTNRTILPWTTVCLSGLLLIFSIAPILRGQGQQTASGRISFTRAQSEAGGRVYTEKCASCHGNRLDDGAAPPLAGQKFFDTWAAANRSLDDLHFIISSTMPKNQAGTLSASDYNAVLAFILDRNGYPAGDRELTADQNALAALRLTPPTSATHWLT